MPIPVFEEGVGIGIFAVLAVIIVLLILVNAWSQRTRQHHEGIVPGQSSGNTPSAGVDHLGNYYVLSSYNTCCEGEYNNGNVSTAQVRKVLKAGARFIDFAIYTMPESCSGSGATDEPAVAGSASVSDLTIGTANCLPLTEVIREVAATAFSAGRVPRPTEPLLLHCRIRTRHPNTLTTLGHLIRREFGSRLLPAEQYGGSDTHGPATVSILTTPLADLRGKCIVILDAEDRSWVDNRALASVVNIAQGAGEPFFTTMSAPVLRATAAPTQLRDANKQRLMLVTPTNSNGSGPVSYPSIVTQWLGCQLAAIPFQIQDQNTSAAIEYFNKANSGFVLKPEQLQQHIIALPKSKPQNKDLSYEKRTTTKPYMSFSV
jgi:hypothetical protein